MPIHEELDERRIIQRIREDLRLKIRTAEPVRPSPGTAPVMDDLSLMHSGFDIYGAVPLKSPRRILGAPVTFAKKLLRRLMAPILDRQVSYNAANTRVVQELKNRLENAAQQQVQQQSTAMIMLREEVDRFVTAMREELERWGTVSAARQSALEDDVGGRLATFQEELRRSITRQERFERRTARLESERTPEELARVERRMRRLLHLLEQGAARPGGAAELIQDGDGDWREFDYSALEDRFRGTEAEIKDRQRRYLKYFEGREPVLDIGCGRGEFLELLREAGVRASGVDLNLDMVLLCREKGLEIAHQDAFAYLQRIPDGSLGGAFSAQFIEHCLPREVFRLAQLCQRKLRPGGVLIFETVNPKCLSVFARSFYLDPTHVWPFHPELARFILETAGFADITLEFFSPVDPEMRLPHLDVGSLSDKDKEHFDRSVDNLNELLFGDQEYAIVGAKPLPDTGAG